jgi:hypothetical protein
MIMIVNYFYCYLYRENSIEISYYFSTGPLDDLDLITSTNDRRKRSLAYVFIYNIVYNNIL